MLPDASMMLTLFKVDKLFVTNAPCASKMLTLFSYQG